MEARRPEIVLFAVPLYYPPALRNAERIYVDDETVATSERGAAPSPA